jgi:hypothetical protein
MASIDSLVQEWLRLDKVCYKLSLSFRKEDFFLKKIKLFLIRIPRQGQKLTNFMQIEILKN